MQHAEDIANKEDARIDQWNRSAILWNNADFSIPRHLHGLQFGFPCCRISWQNWLCTL